MRVMIWFRTGVLAIITALNIGGCLELRTGIAEIEDWCPESGFSEGSSWPVVHHDRCMTDYYPKPLPHCVEEAYFAHPELRLLANLSPGSDVAGTMYGTSLRPGVSNVFAAPATDRRRLVWEKDTGILAGLGAPTLGQVWRISARALESAAQRARDQVWYERAQGVTDPFFADASRVRMNNGTVLPRPQWLVDALMQRLDVVYVTAGEPNEAGDGFTRTSVDAWLPDGTPLWRFPGTPTLPVASLSSNLTSDGHLVVNTITGKILVFDGLNGTLRGRLDLWEDLAARHAAEAGTVPTSQTLLSVNTPAVSVDPATGLNRIYVTVVQSPLPKLTNNVFDYSAPELQAGYLVAAIWEPSTDNLSFGWSSYLGRKTKSETTPSIDPRTGNIVTVYSAEDEPDSRLYVFDPDGTEVASHPVTGKLYFSVTLHPGDLLSDTDDRLYMFFISGAEFFLQLRAFVFDRRTLELRQVYEPHATQDPYINTGLVVDRDGILYFAGKYISDGGKNDYLIVYDIREQLRDGGSNGPGKVLDRVRIRQTSCTTVSYDERTDLMFLPLLCPPVSVSSGFDTDWDEWGYHAFSREGAGAGECVLDE
ncbi:MAG: hypothetical protein D6761_06060 [Candidatus Dadabacteria bacterium]|nr:MAG: hypothetical protein D6761_06060 [Candidatus Dadabacteria bacterium]